MVANGENNDNGADSNNDSCFNDTNDNSGTNRSVENILTRKKTNLTGVTDITINGDGRSSGSAGSGAAARRLVQTLVDNGIISPGNKSTIRVVDTLNLGTSQVNLIRLVQPDGNVIIPLQQRTTARHHGNNNSHILNSNNNININNNNILNTNNDKTAAGIINSIISRTTTSSFQQQQNNSSGTASTTTLLFDSHVQQQKLITGTNVRTNNGSSVGTSVVVGSDSGGAGGSTSLVILAPPSSSVTTSGSGCATSISASCESIKDDMSTATGGGGGLHQVYISATSSSSSTSSLTQQNSNDGEPIKLPENLESLPKAEHFPTQRHRWNTNEEIAAILISFERHADWQSKEVKIRPKSGSMLLYSRKKVRYRRDGYCWKKRKDGKTTREDHMKLKVQGTECIYGCYVHSAILPTFHRRCYWLLQNPDIVLVHYLNVPYPDDNKLAVITPSLALWGDKKEWTKEELVSQLKPMFYSEDEPDLNNELEISTAETVEAIVSQLMEKQRCARAAALSKQLECGCPDSTCADGKICSHPMRRITAAKPANSIVTAVTHSSSSQCKPEITTVSHQLTSDNNNQVSSTTGPGIMLSNSGNTTNNGGHPHHQQHHRLMGVNMHETRASFQLHHSHPPVGHHAQQHQQHPPTIISTGHQVSNCQTIGGVSTVNTSASGPPLVLSLSQIQSSGGLLILNSAASASQHHDTSTRMTTSSSFINSTRSHRNLLHRSNTISGGDVKTSSMTMTVLPKQEAMELEVISSCQVLSSSTRRLNDNSQANTALNKKQTGSTLTGSLTDCRLISITNNSSNNNNNTTMTERSNSSSNNNNSVVEKMDVANSGGNILSDSDNVIKIDSQQPLPSPKQMNTTSLTTGSSSSSSSTSSIAGVRDHRYHRTSHHTNANDLSSALMDVRSSYSNILDSENDVKHTVNVHNSNNGGHISGGHYFNETLDLSQEDIQRTLSANMPMSCSTPEPQHSDRTVDGVVVCSKSQSSSETDVLVLNPMDFIDVTVLSPPNTVDDDVFVNLDAFDMLGDFPELEVLEHNPSNNDNSSSQCGGGTICSSSSTNVNTNNNNNSNDKNNDDITPSRSPLVDTDSDKGGHSRSDQTSPPLQYRQGTASITDYSPEWAYPEGGVKVLVTGPWYSTTSPYTVLFDSFPVPTTLVQSGVLRCYCPAHEVGLVTLQVACDGFVISNSAMFEYKTPPESHNTTHQGTRDVAINDNNNLLKFTLLHRLEAMDGRLHIKQEPDATNDVEDTCLFKQNSFEDRLVTYCQGLSQRVWLGNGGVVNEFSSQLLKATSWCTTNLKSMTLLHLAASLGYSRLVCAMLHWKAENSSLILDMEVDAMSQDDDGFTPLMWACTNGHRDTALLLYQWNHSALTIRNNRLQTAVDCAVIGLHSKLADELQNLEMTRLKNSDNIIATMLNNDDCGSSFYKKKSNGALNNVYIKKSSSILNCKNNMMRESSSSRDEGIFLRPEAVSNIISVNVNSGGVDKSKTANAQLQLQLNIPSSNISSNGKYGCDMNNTGTNAGVEEGRGRGGGGGGGEMIDSDDAIDKGWRKNSEQLMIPSSQCSNSAASSNNNDNNNNNSHSNNKLIKRQSVDSGIQLDSNNSSSATNNLTNSLYSSLTSSYLSSSSSSSSTSSSSVSSPSTSATNINNNNNNNSSSKSYNNNNYFKRNDINSAVINHSGCGSEPKSSRFDRSMSLPISSPSTVSSLSSSGVDSAYDSSSLSISDPLFHSPVRRMDFTLCDTIHDDLAVDAADQQVNTDQGGDFLLLKQLELNDDFSSNDMVTSHLLLMSPGDDKCTVGFVSQNNVETAHGDSCHFSDTNVNTEGDDLMIAGSVHDSNPTTNTSTPSSSGSATSFTGEQEVRVLTLAEQIIAAMPERIKNESEEMTLLLSNTTNSNNSSGSFATVEVMSTESASSVLLDEVHNHNQNVTTESSPSCCFDNSETAFTFDHNYRYYDVATPNSSLSPASSSCLPSPSPSSFALPDSPSPPPTTADFCEFFHAGSSNSLFFEKDFSNLTLSDREQRELYEAAKIIQKAYRSYKGRKKLEEQDKERAAAVLIQNYYRRYKQYAYFKQMTKAAMVIQNGFRSYCEHKRFKKNQQAETEAALRIQNYYRSYREQSGVPNPSDTNNNNCGNVSSGNCNTPPPNGLKRTYSQRRQHQAARKIQQFMRQSKNIMWDIEPGTLIAERASRKREAGVPLSVTQGCPPKLALSHHITALNAALTRDKVNANHF